MSTDVESLSVLIASIVDLGAKICVLSDESGLPIITHSKVDNEEVELALSALSSLVTSTGDTISRELSGAFVNMTVRTTGGLLLSTVINSTPKVVLTAIVDENLETTIIHEMNRLEPTIANAIVGIAVEIKEREKLQSTDSRRVSSFFDSFAAKIKNADSAQGMVNIIRSSKDDLFTLIYSGTISYEMNRFALNLEKLSRSKTITQESLIKIKEEILKSVENWKSRLS
ncbi:hypothetical protein [Candidatus Hodarchaeum mangrovi]